MPYKKKAASYGAVGEDTIEEKTEKKRLQRKYRPRALSHANDHRLTKDEYIRLGELWQGGRCTMLRAVPKVFIQTWGNRHYVLLFLTDDYDATKNFIRRSSVHITIGIFEGPCHARPIQKVAEKINAVYDVMKDSDPYTDMFAMAYMPWPSSWSYALHPSHIGLLEALRGVPKHYFEIFCGHDVQQVTDREFHVSWI